MGVSLSAPILDDYREFSRARILNHLKAMSLDGKDMTKMENKTNHGRSNFASTGKVTPRKIPTNQKWISEQQNSSISLIPSSKAQNITGSQSQSNSPIKLKKLQNKQYLYRYQHGNRNFSTLSPNKKCSQAEKILPRKENEEQICQQTDNAMNVLIQPQIQGLTFEDNQINEFSDSPRPQTTFQKLLQQPNEFKRSAKYVLPKLKLKSIRKYSNLQTYHKEGDINNSVATLDEAQKKIQKDIKIKISGRKYCQQKLQIIANQQFQCKIKNHFSNLRKKRCLLAQNKQSDSMEQKNPQFTFQSLISKQKFNTNMESSNKNFFNS